MSPPETARLAPALSEEPERDPLPTLDDEPDYLRAGKGIGSWLNTRDHKRIALMFYGAVLVHVRAGRRLRAGCCAPSSSRPSARSWTRPPTTACSRCTASTMVLLFLIPRIPNVFGNFILPIMLGARDLAFPRLNLISFYVYLVGAHRHLGGMFAGGADTGWTFYTPYSDQHADRASFPVVLGIFIVGISSIITGAQLHRHHPHAARARA